jgi:hypothetical protein
VARRSLSPWILAFFGLTFEIAPQARLNLFTQIHEILFHGQGGYDYHTVYNMPIWLRKFTFHKLQEHYTREKEHIENQAKGNSTKLMDSSGNVDKNAFKKLSSS